MKLLRPCQQNQQLVKICLLVYLITLGSNFLYAQSLSEPTERVTGFGLNFPVTPDEPEQMARQFLAEHYHGLGFPNNTLNDLALSHQRKGLSGWFVRFQQTYQGVPVNGKGGVSLVKINNNHEVVVCLNAYAPITGSPSVIPDVSEGQAWDTVKQNENFVSTESPDFIELLIGDRREQVRLNLIK